MAEHEPSILELMQAAGQEPPQVRLPAPPAEGEEVEQHPPLRRTGRYEVVGPLAEGGVGEVLRGRDIDLGRDVALKVLRPKYAADPDLIQRLLDEAQIGGQLQHPGVVPVYEVGIDDDRRAFFAMKLVKGQTLAARLARRQGPKQGQRLFLRIFEQLAEAVAYAHARGVVHRDLKPSNVMVGAFGEVQLLDWGFAKVLPRGGRADERRRPTPEDDVTRIASVRAEDSGTKSVAGSVMGTPAYMPPEQAIGDVEHLDERCDVFSLGAVLCEILTGLPPYTGAKDELLTLAAHAKLDDAMARLDACGADDALTALCRRCLAPIRAERPHDASDVAAAVHEHLVAVETRAQTARVAAATARAEAERAATEAQEQRRARRQSLVVAACVLAFLLAAGGGALWLARDARVRDTKASAAIATAMEDAQRLRGEGKLEESLAATTRAEAIAAGASVPPETLGGLADLRTQLEREQVARRAHAAQQAKDDALLARLDALAVRRPLKQGVEAFAARQDESYAQALAQYGLDVETLDPDEAGRRIRASAVRPRLLRALESWYAWRRHADNPRAAEWEHLAAVCDAADADAWSVRVRRAGLAKDLPALHVAAEDGEALAAEPERAVTLATALARAGDLESALASVRSFLVRNPTHRPGRQLAIEVALALENPAEARRHALSLAALDPDCAAYYRNLGAIHLDLDEPDVAERWLEAALDLDPADTDATALLTVAQSRAPEGD